MKNLFLLLTVFALTISSCSSSDDDPIGGNVTTPDASPYAGTWSGTYSGDDTGTWNYGNLK